MSTGFLCLSFNSHCKGSVSIIIVYTHGKGIGPFTIMYYLNSWCHFLYKSKDIVLLQQFRKDRGIVWLRERLEQTIAVFIQIKNYKLLRRL